MLILPSAVLEQICRAASQALPGAAVGFLIGRGGVGHKTVHEVRAGRRREEGGPLELEPRDQLEAERDARSRGLDVLGYYFCLAEGPAEPAVEHLPTTSEGFSYLLVRAEDGRLTERRSFERVFEEFDEEPIEIRDGEG